MQLAISRRIPWQHERIICIPKSQDALFNKTKVHLYMVSYKHTIANTEEANEEINLNNAVARLAPFLHNDYSNCDAHDDFVIRRDHSCPLTDATC